MEIGPPLTRVVEQVLQGHALSPSQQFSNVSGKNATDSSLIVEAMDIVHGGRVMDSVLVSSDSDYTVWRPESPEEASLSWALSVRRSHPPSERLSRLLALEDLSAMGSTV